MPLKAVSRSFSHMVQVWRKILYPSTDAILLSPPSSLSLCGGSKLGENSMHSKALQHLLSSLRWRIGQLLDSRRDAIVWCLSQVHYLNLCRASSVLKTVWDLCSHIIRHYWLKWKMKFIHINNNWSCYWIVHFSNFSGR